MCGGYNTTMAPGFVRWAWSCVLVATACTGIYLFFGSSIDVRASGVHDPVIVRDVLKPGLHILSGVVDVGTGCASLSVKTEKSGDIYLLKFRTWRDPSIVCDAGFTPRTFLAEVFAPVDSKFIATLDDYPISIVVLRETATSPAPGTL